MAFFRTLVETCKACIFSFVLKKIYELKSSDSIRRKSLEL
jgi:hypothetical protein